MGFLRASIRFAAFVFVTLAIYVIWWLFDFVIPNKLYWRQFIFRFWTRIYAIIAGLRIEVIGTPPRPPFFLVCNHLSYTDIAVIRAVVNGVFVAKRDIKNWPIIGRLVGDMGIVFIDRSNKRDIPRAGAEIIERLNAGEGVIVFPEGTSSKGENVLPFNSAFLEFAARTDLPVSFAALSYRTAPGDPPPSATICWWDETSFMRHLFRHFSLRGYTAVLAFGDEPIANPDRKLLARELHAKVSEKFIPVI